MTPVPTMVQFDLPTASELQKLEEKSLIVYVMVGQKQENQSTVPIIQLNSKFVSLEEMPAAIEIIKGEIFPEDQDKMVAVMKIDKNTPMGLVNDIKRILRESSVLTIHYSANKKPLNETSQDKS